MLYVIVQNEVHTYICVYHSHIETRRDPLSIQYNKQSKAKKCIKKIAFLKRMKEKNVRFYTTKDKRENAKWKISILKREKKLKKMRESNEKNC